MHVTLNNIMLTHLCQSMSALGRIFVYNLSPDDKVQFYYITWIFIVIVFKHQTNDSFIHRNTKYLHGKGKSQQQLLYR